MTERLFVYGTLMRGERAHALLGRACRLGDARTAPSFELADLGACTRRSCAGARSRSSKLYEPDPKTLPSLDLYEGCPDVFRREPSSSTGARSARPT